MIGLLIVINTVAHVRTLLLYYRESLALAPAVVTGARLGLILFLLSSAEA